MWENCHDHEAYEKTVAMYTPKNHVPYPRVTLLDVHDGPEGIEIYTSEEEGVVDWSNTFPAVYIVVNTQDAMVKLGPFQCSEIYKQLKEQLK